MKVTTNYRLIRADTADLGGLNTVFEMHFTRRHKYKVFKKKKKKKGNRLTVYDSHLENARV